MEIRIAKSAHFVYLAAYFSRFQDKSRISPNEARIFWASLVAVPLLWGLLALICIFTISFAWLVVTLFGLCMTGANLYGYLRCRFKSKDELQSEISASMLKQV